ncbi:Capsular polysaccharide biosynthesis protein [Amycolatopsis arida]|uniref:Capsular polysaccharide biosynthesis protein n=1 Tax=Amycolatopsis arida TaxID=587909 RepID=A0A1I5XEU3_9PSEU|nr:hypothetical protein [Amycolatopsis arida]TDX97496.1 capsular polysaccharide biosynthesis protein [Amycolatopsis arida]SFQ30502.1 Capsular polysaccharide biosynthesis protein [Amycolatopsis arida]
MEFGDVVRLLGRRWLVVLAAVVAGGLAGLAGAALLPPSYESEVNLLFNRQGAAEVTGGSQDLLQRMPTFAALTTTAAVLDPVADRFGYPGGAQELRKKVTAVTPDSTLLLRITVTDRDPTRATRLADAVAASYADAVRTEFGTDSADNPRIVVATVQPGTAPTAPASPSVPLFVAAGAVGGLMVVTIVLMTVTTLRRPGPEDRRVRERPSPRPREPEPETEPDESRA